MIKDPNPDNDQEYLVIKKTPEMLIRQIGLKITRAYKSDDSNTQIQSFTTVDDLKNFALKGEGRPFDIMIVTDDSLQDHFREIFKERKAKAEAEAKARVAEARLRGEVDMTIPDIKITIKKDEPSDKLGITIMNNDNKEIYVFKNDILKKFKNKTLSVREINISKIKPGLFLKELKINSRKIELTSRREVATAILNATGELEFIFDGNRNYFDDFKTNNIGGKRKRKRKSKRKSRKRKTHRRKTRRH